MSRRTFLGAALGGGSLLAGGVLPFGGWRGVRPQDVLRIGYIGGATGDGAPSAARGLTLGVEEAAQTARLFGRAVELVTGDGEPRAAAERLIAGGASALVGGAGEDACRALMDVAGAARVPFLNVACRSDALRGADCGPFAFHVEASDAMYAAAAQAGDAGVVLWHAELERFGAAQLTERYRARFGEAMDGPAWAGWMAAKSLAEAALRARTAEPAALRAWLAREGTQFDGHKGWPLSFRPWDQQLRQPLYRVDSSGAVAGEVPAGRAEGARSRDLLDALGPNASTSTCSRIREATP